MIFFLQFFSRFAISFFFCIYSGKKYLIFLSIRNYDIFLFCDEEAQDTVSPKFNFLPDLGKDSRIFTRKTKFTRLPLLELLLWL